MWNIKALALMVEQLYARLKFIQNNIISELRNNKTTDKPKQYDPIFDLGGIEFRSTVVCLVTQCTKLYFKTCQITWKKIYPPPEKNNTLSFTITGAAIVIAPIVEVNNTTQQEIDNSVKQKMSKRFNASKHYYQSTYQQDDKNIRYGIHHPFDIYSLVRKKDLLDFDLFGKKEEHF